MVFRKYLKNFYENNVIALVFDPGRSLVVSGGELKKFNRIIYVRPRLLTCGK